VGRSGGRRIALVVVATAVVGASGCVGATARDDFESEVEARGGGFSEDIVSDAVDGIADEVGTEDFELTHLTVSPLTPVVSAQIRDPRAPDQLDDYTFRGDDLVDVAPVRVTAGTDIDAGTLPIATFAVDQLDEVVDVALDEFGATDGYVTSVRLSVEPPVDGAAEPQGAIVVSVESPRAAATVRFTADGELVGVDPR
jgi:hypothetical protein